MDRSKVMRIHRSEDIGLFAVDRDLLSALVARLERRMTFDLSITEQHLYLTLGGETLSGEVVRWALVPPAA